MSWLRVPVRSPSERTWRCSDWFAVDNDYFAVLPSPSCQRPQAFSRCRRRHRRHRASRPSSFSTIPGMVAAPLGTQNGPIDRANLQLLGMNPTAASTLLQHIDNGDVSGYIRLWSHQPPNGDAVLISAFQFQNPDAAGAWLAGENSSLAGHVSGFAVPSISGAEGYTTATSTSTGIPATTNMVFFDKGNISFQVGVVTESGDLTSADAVALAKAQAADAPASPAGPSSSNGRSSSAYRAGEIFGAVIVGLVILWLVSAVVRRSRKSPAKRESPSVEPNSAVGCLSSAPHRFSRTWLDRQPHQHERAILLVRDPMDRPQTLAGCRIRMGRGRTRRSLRERGRHRLTPAGRAPSR